jgi:DNA-binding NarL/FixJ family response regulator
MVPLRILVADDHELMRKAVQALLGGDAGLQVIGEAATGLETIAQVAALRPDLVILDLAMPELDGLEVAARLRQTHPETKIILLTANATPALERQALAAGIVCCLSKSAPPQDLLAAVAASRHQEDRLSFLPMPNPSEPKSEGSSSVAAGPQVDARSPEGCSSQSPRARRATRQP